MNDYQRRAALVKEIADVVLPQPAQRRSFRPTGKYPYLPIPITTPPSAAGEHKDGCALTVRNLNIDVCTCTPPPVAPAEERCGFWFTTTSPCGMFRDDMVHDPARLSLYYHPFTITRLATAKETK